MTAILGNTELRSKGTKIETGQNASIEINGGASSKGSGRLNSTLT